MGSTAKKLMAADLTLLEAGTPDEFYRELTTRNRHFIPPGVQHRLRELKVLVAGCGAGGGACTAPLARLGVTRFRLADNGDYEISNLNRQHTFIDRLGENKAEFHASEILRINPHLDVRAYREGVSRDNLPELLGWADLVIDAVDVTNPVSIELKFHLHEVAHRLRKPVMSPLDPGFCQLGQTYDYRDPRVAPLHGRLTECQRAKHPMKALFTMFPVDCLPPHALPLLLDLIEKPGSPASQLGASADLLSGVIVAAVTRFADDGHLIPGWYLNVDHYAYPFAKRLRLWLQSFSLKRQLKRLLRSLP